MSFLKYFHIYVDLIDQLNCLDHKSVVLCLINYVEGDSRHNRVFVHDIMLKNDTICIWIRAKEQPLTQTNKQFIH